jgi:hypothetical protein
VNTLHFFYFPNIVFSFRTVNRIQSLPRMIFPLKWLPTNATITC